MKEEGSLI